MEAINSRRNFGECHTTRRNIPEGSLTGSYYSKDLKSNTLSVLFYPHLYFLQYYILLNDISRWAFEAISHE
jgi:hypothetical protein